MLTSTKFNFARRCSSWKYYFPSAVNVHHLGSKVDVTFPSSLLRFFAKPFPILSHYKHAFTFGSLNVSPDYSIICISYTLGQSSKVALGVNVLAILDPEWSYLMEQ